MKRRRNAQEPANASISPVVTNGSQHTSQQIQTPQGCRDHGPDAVSQLGALGSALLPCPDCLSGVWPQPLPKGKPQSQRTRWHGCIGSVASSSLSRSSFLACSQPIIRQILKGERRLPARMTSCGLCRYLSRCGICLPGNAAGGSGFAWLEGCTRVPHPHKYPLPLQLLMPRAAVQFPRSCEAPLCRKRKGKGRGVFRGL